MGLRINTSAANLTALRTLKLNDREMVSTLEKMSTGLRINKASDDPAGLVISELLRNQINALNQAVDNSSSAKNLLDTADAALSQMNDLLHQVRTSVIFAMNKGAITSEQIIAEQDVVDAAVVAIDRIATTTRFAGKTLFNGTGAFQLTSSVPSQLKDIQVFTTQFAPNQTVKTISISPSQLPLRGQIRLTNISNSATQITTIRLTGARGTADVNIAPGGTASQIATAINSVSSLTGIFASNTTDDIDLFTETFGSDQRESIQVLSGVLVSSASAGGLQIQAVSSTNTSFGATMATIQNGQLNPGLIVTSTGRNGVITFSGRTFIGVGNKFSIVDRNNNISFSLNPDGLPTTTAAMSFQVNNTGINFHLGELTTQIDRLPISLPDMGASVLGFDTQRDLITEALTGGAAPVGGVTGTAGNASAVLKNGFLSSLKTGESNSLTNNPDNANQIVELALNKINKVRGFIGSTVKGVIENNITRLTLHKDQLTNSVSNIRDLDFAEEVAKFTKQQIYFQSNISVLGSANALPQAILSLLGGR